MKLVKLFIILLLITSCTERGNDTLKVTSLDQIYGIWEWESTCGGIIDNCAYPSKTNYQEIEFKEFSQFLERNNDTLSLSATYSIERSDNVSGTLVLIKTVSNDTLSQNAIGILNNRLVIFAGELTISYKKIK
jgi:hypothetical protein